MGNCHAAEVNTDKLISNVPECKRKTPSALVTSRGLYLQAPRGILNKQQGAIISARL